MKFYEQMDPTERETMIRKAVAFSVYLEGMDDTAQAILQETVQEKSKKILSTIEPKDDQTNE
jgi:hypothetical protein